MTNSSPTDRHSDASAADIPLPPPGDQPRSAPTAACMPDGPPDIATHPGAQVAIQPAAHSTAPPLAGADALQRPVTDGPANTAAHASGAQDEPLNSPPSNDVENAKAAAATNPAQQPSPPCPAGRRRSLHLPTRDEVNASLVRLAAGVLRSTVSRQDAATVRATLETYLRHSQQDKKTSAGQRSIDIDALRDAAQREPGILHILEPLLSDEELQQLACGKPTASVDEPNVLDPSDQSTRSDHSDKHAD